MYQGAPSSLRTSLPAQLTLLPSTPPPSLPPLRRSFRTTARHAVHPPRSQDRPRLRRHFPRWSVRSAQAERRQGQGPVLRKVGSVIQARCFEAKWWHRELEVGERGVTTPAGAAQDWGGTAFTAPRHLFKSNALTAFPQLHRNRSRRHRPRRSDQVPLRAIRPHHRRHVRPTSSGERAVRGDGTDWGSGQAGHDGDGSRWSDRCVRRFVRVGGGGADARGTQVKLPRLSRARSRMLPTLVPSSSRNSMVTPREEEPSPRSSPIFALQSLANAPSLPASPPPRLPSSSSVPASTCTTSKSLRRKRSSPRCSEWATCKALWSRRRRSRSPTRIGRRT